MALPLQNSAEEPGQYEATDATHAAAEGDLTDAAAQYQQQMQNLPGSGSGPNIPVVKLVLMALLAVVALAAIGDN